MIKGNLIPSSTENDMDIQDLLKEKEGENCEFKEAKNNFDFEKLVQYACALSNRG